jgi:hypothetical protein
VPIIPALGRLTLQEGHRFKASLGYIVREKGLKGRREEEKEKEVCSFQKVLEGFKSDYGQWVANSNHSARAKKASFVFKKRVFGNLKCIFKCTGIMHK